MKKIIFILTLTFLLIVLSNSPAQCAPELTVEGETHLATVSGNVGVGTTSPGGKLAVNADSGDLIRLSGAAPQIKFQDTTTGETDYWMHCNSGNLYFIWDANDDGSWSGESPWPLYFQGRNAYFDASTLAVDATNNRVGIGTATPSKTLDVSGDANISTRLNIATGTETGTRGLLQAGGTFSAASCGVFGKSRYGVIGHSTDVFGAGVAGNTLVATDPDSPTGGVVGRGATRGVYGEASGAGGDGVRGVATSSTGRAVVAYASSTTGTNVALLAQTNSPTGWAGEFRGRVRTNAADPSIGLDNRRVMYGPAYFDIAEKIPARDCEECDVVIIDLDNNVMVTKSNQPYQTSVAGVISEKPMFYIDDTSIEGRPLALAGRVRCKVTAENGSIKRGDILVTSSKPGYAMKGDIEKIKYGMVVGKALEPLDSGEGKILVLVE